MKNIALADLDLQPVSHNPAIQKKVLLSSGEVPGLVQLAQAVLSAGQVAPAHAHTDLFEVFFVRSGRGVIEIDGVRCELKRGDCVAVEPGELHEVSNPYDDELVLLYLGLRAEQAVGSATASR